MLLENALRSVGSKMPQKSKRHSLLDGLVSCKVSFKSQYITTWRCWTQVSMRRYYENNLSYATFRDWTARWLAKESVIRVTEWQLYHLRFHVNEIKNSSELRIKVLMAEIMKIAAFWDIARYQHLRGSCCLYHQGYDLLPWWWRQ
jgi:hypothetical protein